ncbi:tripartite tricarboxylate transporter substrate binding protein [Bordetella petrii]|uniref:tripartite tricarboxylate transporter substrate binding protein n=1 Tax=Bordetella petrii TaxID=94624 RepID=UPI001A9681DB|nr:tripartite tricarboxylate transporter substrate binding protein [Bordetella petrii]MBO1110780.1 tripartite tricarboxylate transporter substrate binding protein [Bordetella petrii]
MNIRLSRRSMLALLGAAALAPAYGQQPYPSKPVTIVVPFAVGGSTDLVARLIGDQLGNALGQPAIVTNRTGGGGVVGWSNVARAEPDGYTVLTTEMSFAIAPGLLSNLPFNAKKDFTHITTAVQVPHVLVVNPGVPAKTVQELIALAKKKPGELFYGSGGNGTNTHLAAELFKDAAGNLDIVHVPYKGAGAVLADLMGGQVQMLITSLPTALPHIKSGKLRALMVASDKRSPALPDVPSAPEAGLPRMDIKFWIGFAAPAGTPQAAIDKLNQSIIATLRLPASQQRLEQMGLETIGNTPAEATRLVEQEMGRWAKVIKQRGIKVD